jgi:hypothetical protein
MLSNGAVCIVDTPFQRKQKITDSPVLAQKDFLGRGAASPGSTIKWNYVLGLPDPRDPSGTPGSPRSTSTRSG